MILIDELYEAGFLAQFLEALRIPDHPEPVVANYVAHYVRVDVDWQNGAYMEMMCSRSNIHFETLCSSVGDDAPTGLYSGLFSKKLLPLLKQAGIRTFTCEPTDESARYKLGTRGEWEDTGSYWLWTLDADHEALLEAARMADYARSIRLTESV